MGSLPLGMINLTVAETAMRRGFRIAVPIAAGASFVELFQVLIAVKFAQFFTDNPQVETIIQWVAVVVFLGLGLFFWLKKPAPVKPDSGQKAMGFAKGMGLAAINVLAIPFWVFWGIKLAADGLLQSQNLFLFLFALGSALGTFLLLLTYAKLSVMIFQRMSKIQEMTGKIIGTIFLGLGVYQLVSLLF